MGRVYHPTRSPTPITDRYVGPLGPSPRMIPFKVHWDFMAHNGGPSSAHLSLLLAPSPTACRARARCARPARQWSHRFSPVPAVARCPTAANLPTLAHYWRGRTHHPTSRHLRGPRRRRYRPASYTPYLPRRSDHLHIPSVPCSWWPSTTVIPQHHHRRIARLPTSVDAVGQTRYDENGNHEGYGCAEVDEALDACTTAHKSLKHATSAITSAPS